MLLFGLVVIVLNAQLNLPVTPGDQIRFEVEILQMRRQVCRMRGIGYVDGQIASEAEFTAAIMDR